jgi:hypothetical protein
LSCVRGICGQTRYSLTKPLAHDWSKGVYE